MCGKITSSGVKLTISKTIWVTSILEIRLINRIKQTTTNVKLTSGLQGEFKSNHYVA